MSDQSVRVTRILGWEYSTVSEWGDMGWWRPDDPDAPPLADDRPYDTDDLLAWLGQNAVKWWIDPVWAQGQRMVSVSWRTSHPGGDVVSEIAPTLLAALEAAVLAVAEAWPQRWMTGINTPTPNPEGDPQ